MYVASLISYRVVCNKFGGFYRDECNNFGECYRDVCNKFDVRYKSISTSLVNVMECM